MESFTGVYGLSTTQGAEAIPVLDIYAGAVQVYLPAGLNFILTS
jgi:hypothetical protein